MYNNAYINYSSIIITIITLLSWIEYVWTQVEPEKDITRDKCSSITTTYEDIMSFLGTLENGIII